MYIDRAEALRVFDINANYLRKAVIKRIRSQCPGMYNYFTNYKVRLYKFSSLLARFNYENESCAAKFHVND